MKLHVFACLAALLALGNGCSAAGRPASDTGSGATGNGNGGTSSVGMQPNINVAGDIALGGGVGTGSIDDGKGAPEDCASAAMGHTYVGSTSGRPSSPTRCGKSFNQRSLSPTAPWPTRA